MYSFVHNCQAHRKQFIPNTGPLIGTSPELLATCNSIEFFQHRDCSSTEEQLPSRIQCSVIPSPFLDDKSSLRVGGREQHSKLNYGKQHPIILHGTHPLSKLIIRNEHHTIVN